LGVRPVAIAIAPDRFPRNWQQPGDRPIHHLGWRGALNSGPGHVGFYRSEDANSVWTLGGNESDMVQLEALLKSSASFGLIGYWWPKSVPLPTGGPIIMPTGSPIHLQSPPSNLPATSTAATTEPNGKQTRIIATMFRPGTSATDPPQLREYPLNQGNSHGGLAVLETECVVLFARCSWVKQRERYQSATGSRFGDLQPSTAASAASQRVTSTDARSVPLGIDRVR
jgi:hypothetical protein